MLKGRKILKTDKSQYFGKLKMFENTIEMKKITSENSKNHA